MPCSKRGKVRVLRKHKSPSEWEHKLPQWHGSNAHWQLESILHQLRRCEGTSRRVVNVLYFASRKEAA